MSKILENLLKVSCQNSKLSSITNDISTVSLYRNGVILNLEPRNRPKHIWVFDFDEQSQPRGKE